MKDHSWKAINEPNQTQLTTHDPRYFKKYQEAKQKNNENSLKNTSTGGWSAISPSYD